VRALIATDVAARGVHVDGVEAVVHFDPPEDHATYIHRSGRTARAGASGVVVSMWAPGSRRAVQTLQRGAGLDVELGAPDLTTLGDPKVAPERLETKRAETKRTETKRTDATRAETRRTPRERRTGRPAFEQVAPVHARTDAALTGTIVSYNAGKGFGFIDAGQGKDLFVHHSNLTANLTSKVRPGQRVRFEVREGRRGPEAVAVAAL
jgi:superfamily II DNA/RNA helicase